MKYQFMISKLDRISWSCLLWLALVVVLVSMLNSVKCGLDFDLNDPAPMEEPEKADKYKDKVTKVFEHLKICSDPNFDISTAVIPNDFSVQRKAYMILKKMSLLKLLTEEDKAKFAIIRANCIPLMVLIKKKRFINAMEKGMTSGGNYDQTEQFEKLKQSPLEKLKRRLPSRKSSPKKAVDSKEITIINNKQQQPRSWFGSGKGPKLFGVHLDPLSPLRIRH